ncbi:MAG: S1 family peptidase, partial [Planctomycetota bacterium]
AGHCVEAEPLNVMVRSADGRFHVRPARVVWRGAAREPGSDLALVHVEGVTLRPLRWCAREEAAPGRPVLVVGTGAIGPRSAGGKIVGEQRPGRAAPPGTTVHVTTIAVVPGDSGGPVVMASGELLGVAVELGIDLFGDEAQGIVARPDPAWLESVMNEDREVRGAAIGPRKKLAADDAAASPLF